MIDKGKATIVNLYGGPGVGKSTTAAAVFSLLKLHDVDCELIPEYAKDLVWEERHKTFKDQLYLFAKQNHRLWRVHDKVKVVITDCPLMLSMVYGAWYKVGTKELYDNIVRTTNEYNNIHILLERTKAYNANGRNQTEDEAKIVDQAVKDTLNKYEMGWTRVPGNFAGINRIANIVLEKLKIKQKFHVSVKGE